MMNERKIKMSLETPKPMQAQDEVTVFNAYVRQ